MVWYGIVWYGTITSYYYNYRYYYYHYHYHYYYYHSYYGQCRVGGIVIVIVMATIYYNMVIL